MTKKCDKILVRHISIACIAISSTETFFFLLNNPICLAIVCIFKVLNFTNDFASKGLLSNMLVYGFLKLHLNSITRLDTVNTIIEKSITNLAEATKGKPEFANIAPKVRYSANIALESMKDELRKRPENPFMGVAVDYLKELYNNPPSIDIGKMMVIAKSMQLLYGTASNLTQDVKIVK